MRCAGSSINARSVLPGGVTSKDDSANYGCCRPALPLCVPSTVAKHGATTGKIWSSLSPEAPFVSSPAERPVGSRPSGSPPLGPRWCRAEIWEPNCEKPSGHGVRHWPCWRMLTARDGVDRHCSERLSRSPKPARAARLTLGLLSSPLRSRPQRPHGEFYRCGPVNRRQLFAA
jgi:hypothetical protein